MTDPDQDPVVTHEAPADTDGQLAAIHGTDPVTDPDAKNAELAETPPDEMHQKIVEHEQSRFDAAPAENPAHPVAENPLDHVGDEEPDPWDKKEA